MHYCCSIKNGQLNIENEFIFMIFFGGGVLSCLITSMDLWYSML